MKKRIICRVLMCLMIFALIPVQSFAIDRIDLSHPVTLTVNFNHEGQSLPGAELQLYRVAEMNEWAEFTFLEEYQNYPIKLDDIAGTDWTDLAYTLDAYIKLDGLEPWDAGVTDANGTLTLPRMRMPLQPGLYLITGNTLTYNDMCFTPAPTLIALPNREGDSHQWDYNVTAEIKYTFRTAPVDCTVMKVWKDDGSESKRPESVTVYLLKDGVVYDTAQLSRDNEWMYTWTELERGSDWTIAEEPAKDYTVSITQERKEPSELGLEIESVSSGHTLFTVTNIYEEPPGGELPQTGSLWWPVPVLMIAGLIFLIIGLLKIKGLKHEA